DASAATQARPSRVPGLSRLHVADTDTAQGIRSSSPTAPSSPAQGDGSPKRNETLEERLLRKIPMLREMEMQERGLGSGNQEQDLPASAMTTGARGMARRGSPRVALDAEPLADKRQSVRFEARDDQDLNRRPWREDAGSTQSWNSVRARQQLQRRALPSFHALRNPELGWSAQGHDDSFSQNSLGRDGSGRRLASEAAGLISQRSDSRTNSGVPLLQGSGSNSLTSASQPGRNRRKPLADIFPTAKSEPQLRKDSGSLDPESSVHDSSLHRNGHAAGQERTAARDMPPLAPSGPPDDDYSLHGLCSPDDDDELEDDAVVIHMSSDEITDARSRLVSGLKRYFRSKRFQGLLSVKSLRILDTACDARLNEPDKPLNLWTALEKDACDHYIVQSLAYVTFRLRKVNVFLRQRRHDEKGVVWIKIKRALSWPLMQITHLLKWILSKIMLQACEVAQEYMLSLIYAPQVQLLRTNRAAAPLMEEVQEEVGKVWKFIVEREIEAPERFRAIQTYRATMAVLRQQVSFLDQLFDSGVIDEMEKDILEKPVEEKETQLQHRGPKWRTATMTEVLHNLPFLRHAPRRVVELLLRHGRLKMHRSQHPIAINSGGLWVVNNGLVKVTYTPNVGSEQQYFLGSGGVVGLLKALTGSHMPGKSLVIAEGNSLGRGPVIFHLSPSGIAMIRKHAAAGEAVWEQMELDMFRMAALYVVERLKPQLFSYLTAVLSAANPAPSRPTSKTEQMARTETPRSEFGTESWAEDDEQERADMQIHQQAWETFTRLTRAMTKAALVILEYGQRYPHTTHLVLMQGSLTLLQEPQSGRRRPSKRSGSSGQSLEYTAPMVLPFLGEAISQSMQGSGSSGAGRGGLRRLGNINSKSFSSPENFLSAGTQGAVFLACPDAAGNSPPAPVGTPQAPPARPSSTVAQDSALQLPQAASVAEGKQPAAEGNPPSGKAQPDSQAKPGSGRIHRIPQLHRRATMTQAEPLDMSMNADLAELAAPPQQADARNWWDGFRSRRPSTNQPRPRA
ncbi:hypothetical protein WJX84_008386, partial [Apatococcus fuscideae]